jgi:hypothetical protein
VERICEHIPLGQPILVGHHSEKHARKDAERIDNGMRRAVKMWEESRYWKDRAQGAIRAVKYKERPDVRARRIKGIEADKRREERTRAEAEHVTRFWSGELFAKRATGEERPITITEENRGFLRTLLGQMSSCGVTIRGTNGCCGTNGCYYTAYEMLSPDADRYPNCPRKTVAELKEIALRQQADLIARCNRWIGHYDNRLAYERAMLAGDGGTATDRTGPEKGGAVKCWASVRRCWSYVQKVNRVSVTVLDNWGNGSGSFTRTIPFDKCTSVMTAAEVQTARASGRLVETSCKTGFGLLGDSTAAKACASTDELHEIQHAEAVAAKAAQEDNAGKFEALREQAKVGVEVVTAPNLFPTPPDLARRMVQLCEIHEGDRVLEPSAGTGNIAAEIVRNTRGTLLCVEINLALAAGLARLGYVVHRADFLSCNGELGTFQRIVMNPPFDHGSDIKHVDHARQMLNPGGRLVAIVANGARQREALEPLCTSWEELPPNTFKEQGTSVKTALIVIDA